MSRKILTIDDSKTLRMIIRGSLTPFGLQVLEAENGALGVDVAKAEQPDLILLDYNMPVMDGRETLEMLRASRLTKDIPVIMLTTEAGGDTVAMLAQKGLSGYIVKPFQKEDLLQKVNSLLNLWHGNTPPSEAQMKKMAADAGKPMVMAVDDKETVLKTLEQYFAKDHRFVKASSGTEAVALIKKSPPDALLLDIDMPGTSGLEVFRETCQILKKHGTLVYAMVLQTEDRDIKKAKGAGISDLLLKPFGEAEVNGVIARLAGGGDDAGPTNFLTENDGVYILKVPPSGDASLKAFHVALDKTARKQVKDMAEEGHSELIIEATFALADVNLAKSFIGLIGLAHKLSMSVLIVAADDSTKSALGAYAEMSELPTCDTLEEAMASLSS